MEDDAIGEHRKQGSDGPCGASCGGRSKGETSPEKNQHAESHGNALSASGSEIREETTQKKIEEGIGVLMHEMQAGQISLGDSLGQPCDVDMTPEVARLNVLVPEAGYKQDGRSCQKCVTRTE